MVCRTIWNIFLEIIAKAKLVLRVGQSSKQRQFVSLERALGFILIS